MVEFEDDYINQRTLSLQIGALAGQGYRNRNGKICSSIKKQIFILFTDLYHKSGLLKESING